MGEEVSKIVAKAAKAGLILDRDIFDELMAKGMSEAMFVRISQNIIWDELVRQGRGQ